MTMTHNPTATATVETITPAIAEEMLTRNHGNRPLREGRAEALAAAMVRGEWKLNGETIKIARDGRVLDGQHRLWAIVLAERPIETFVIRGLEGDVFTTIDVGAKRTVSDMLATSGHISTRCLAAAATILYRHDRGLWAGYHGTNAPTPDQLLELVATEPLLTQCVPEANRMARAVRMPPGLLAGCMVILSRVDADAAQEFFGYLERGHSDPAHPIHVLRRWLTNDAAGQRRSDPHQIAARVFKAWNAWRLGKSPQYLKWTAAEPFPRPV